MTDKNRKRCPDRIKKMLLDDPYRALHVWNATRTKQYLENLKQTTGIEPKKGPWSFSEVQQLEDNMKLYQSLNPHVKIFKLFYEKKSKTKNRLFTETQFWNLIAFNLCRKMENINMFVTNYFIEKVGYKAGPFSKQEHGIVKELVKKHGNNWQLISNLTNRCANDLSMVYNSILKNHVNSGTWHKDEKEKFFCIVKQQMHYNQSNQLPLFKISWRVVSDFVQTRNLDACRSFLRKKKKILENIFINSNTKSTSIMKEAIILYTFFSTNQSAVELNKQELLLLFDGKYTENELLEEYNNIISVLPKADINASIRSEQSELIQQCENLFKRINFENVNKTMTNHRTISWLKTKYYILVSENIEKFKDKTSEEIISILHDKYCTTKLVNKDNKSNETQSFVREKINSSIDLTFLSDDDSINDISDDDYNDLTHLSDHSDIADVLESDEVINID